MSEEYNVTITMPALDGDGDVYDKEINCTVEYTYHGGYKGYRDSMGVPMEPDDEPEIELISVIDDNGRDYLPKLTHEQVQDIEQACFNHASETCYDDYY